MDTLVDKYPENLSFVLLPIRAVNEIFVKTKVGVSFDMKKWSSIREGLKFNNIRRYKKI